MLELASLGAKVLQTRSVELAMRYKVRLQVLSSFDDVPGTLVCDEEEIMESRVVSGVAHSRDEAKMTVIGVPDRPGRRRGAVRAAGRGRRQRRHDRAEHRRRRPHRHDLLLPGRRGAARARRRSRRRRADGELDYAGLDIDEDVAKVSIVGIGMRSQAGVAHRMFQALAADGVNIKVITTSEIKVSVLIDRKYLELAVQALHDAFELDRAS